MLNTQNGSLIQMAIEHQHTQRTIQRLARAVAQALQLRVEDPNVILAPYLGQPITLGNHQAMQQWVATTLATLDLTADSNALGPLCDHLMQTLDEVI